MAARQGDSTMTGPRQQTLSPQGVSERIVSRVPGILVIEQSKMTPAAPK